MGSHVRRLLHSLFVVAFAAIVAAALQPAVAECRFLLDSCEDAPPERAPPQPPPQPQPQPQYYPPAEQPRRTSYWNHNGSIMTLRVDGDLREFYYAQPRPGMVAEGVTPGTLLFTGRVFGQSINGTAYLFSRHCGARAYQVQGAVQENGGRVIMSGVAYSIDKNCRVKRAINDTLIFTYMYSQ